MRFVRYLILYYNETPYKRMFNTRDSLGSTITSWLSTPGPVLMRKFANPSKYDPNVGEVSLLEVNPNYAFVRLPIMEQGQPFQ